MKRQLVFLPIAASEMDVLSGEIAVADRVAYTVTPRLLEELGYGENDSEDAEYAALVLASVAALTTHGERLVVVAEVDPALVRAGDDPDNGQIVLTSCPASAITAWFADEPGTDVADAAALSKGLTIDEAWDLPQVQALLHEHDLLWNDVVEYRRG
ncbi:MAG: hypothetical protein IPJ61_04675 [Tessaracoccus sp.]|uniref:DUF6912 family protein n=1 Tax=Tessaracoccus sp. TaxID=1971211 RepID=UPI001EBA1E6F|nr:hypothetical protein [Tessaracoccus sp.]MBK7820372.1 hypothetical protein [Tessaracoccus sp.]